MLYKRACYLLLILFMSVVFWSCGRTERIGNPSRIQTVSGNQVTLNDEFWLPRLEINRKVTIPVGFRMCEETGRIDNFRIAGGFKKGKYCSAFPFDDSDVYKIIEGASYVLEQAYDVSLDQYLDSLIVCIAAAQTEDGYLQTWRIIDPEHPGDNWWGNAERWSDIRNGHELYNVGHLYEAAAAHFLATGKRSLLEVAIRNADLVNAIFGPGRRVAVPGHEEIEIGLIKLFRITGNQDYLDLARLFIDRRGMGEERELMGEYHQDHLPVREQRSAIGHAVRAGYLYSAMADMVYYTGDRSYMPALDSIWEDIVKRKTYITGGIGASREGESFGEDYELPNATAYAETCAAIANIFWNHRMFLLRAEGKYYDVLEKTLYNGMLSGVSQSGDRFFYPNPLSSDGQTAFNYGSATRQKWFPCACCPSNISRFIPEIPGYIYATKDDTVYVNLYIANSADITLDQDHLGMMIRTRYPWEGDIKVILSPGKLKRLTLALRIPGWSVNQPVPSDLYTIENPSELLPVIQLNGNRIPLDIRDGYVFINRHWGSGDQVDLSLPLRVLKIKAHPEVESDAGRVALQRGPLVYCLEEADNGKNIDKISISPDTALEVPESSDFGGIRMIRFISRENTCQAIPYFLWSNRGANEMEVWVREEGPIRITEKN
jgi:DUF1680 family protein